MTSVSQHAVRDARDQVEAMLKRGTVATMKATAIMNEPAPGEPEQRRGDGSSVQRRVKGIEDMAESTSRRRFVGRTSQMLGALALTGGSRAWSQNAVDGVKTAAGPASDTKLIERGVGFLRPRQDGKGGWSTQREPGVTALVVTALALWTGCTRRPGRGQGPDVS